MIPEQVQLMIDKICRSCMCESGDMQNVFEKSIRIGDNNDDAMPLSDMLMACAAIQVTSGDGLPYLLCTSCELKLNSTYEFKQQCEKSDLALRELTASPDNKSSNKNNEEDDLIQPDVLGEIFAEIDEDDIPLANREIPSGLICNYCLKLFTSDNALKIHIQEHIGDILRYCPLCPAKYPRTNHLMRHMKSHDQIGNKHSCKICNQKFTLSANLFRHMKKHIEKVEGNAKKETLEQAAINNEDSTSEIEIKIENIAGKSQIEDEGKIDDIKNETNIIRTKDNVIIDVALNEFSDGGGGGGDENWEEESVAKDEDEDELDEEEEEEEEVEEEEDDDDDDDEFIVNNKGKKPRGRPRSKKDNTLYECKECNKILSTYTGLKVHLRRHTGTDLSKCKHCDKTFTKKSHLNRHLHSHGIVNNKTTTKGQGKSDKKTRECEFCDRKFKYKKSFVHHMQAEHGMSDVESENEKTEENNKSILKINVNKTENNDGETGDEIVTAHERMDIGDDADADSKRKIKVHICHVCQAQFARANHLTRHMTLHRAVLTHKCERCEQAFFTEDLLKKHIEQQHINKPYVCTTCNKPFSRGEHLIRHLKLHQEVTVEGQHKCSICESVFSRSDHLARHTKTHLMQDKRHVCIECGKAFNRLDNLKTHQRIHTGLKDNSKLHLCVYCGKEFNNSSNMIVHMRRHTGERPYKCNECGKGFPRSHDLKCHERTHSGEKPYLCTLCGKSFNKSNKLLRHSRVHTGERPYVCNICSRAFTQSNDLALHMRRHTGARPYACGVCPARFIQSGQLKNHRRQTGHWMETQPDLKGGHRVEPVTCAVEPIPIKFKTFGKSRMIKLEEQNNASNLQQIQQQQQQQQQQLNNELQQQQQQQEPQHHHQRILMGIMAGNIKIQNEVQPLILDTNKVMELTGGLLAALPTTTATVIQGVNGEEIKLKKEIGTFNIIPVFNAGSSMEEDLEKHDIVNNSTTTTTTTNNFHQNNDSSVNTSYSTVQTTTMSYTSTENFNFQNFN